MNEQGSDSGINIAEIKLSNIIETAKRITKLVISNYILSLIIFATWYTINFEDTIFDNTIEEANEALKIRELKPFSDFLKSSSNCFCRYYNGFDDELATPDKISKLISELEAENIEHKFEIERNLINPYPIDELKKIPNLPEYNSNIMYWSTLDTLVAFLFSIDSYLNDYFMARFEICRKTGNISNFINSTNYMDLYLDSSLVVFNKKIDSIMGTFESGVRAGYNPIIQHNENLLDNLWGSHRNFEDYTEFELADLLMILERINCISEFKILFRNNYDLLAWASSDLDSIKNCRNNSFGNPDDKISDRSYLRYYPLRYILESKLFDTRGLSENIQLRKINNHKINATTTIPLLIGQNLLSNYYPSYLNFIEKYNQTNVSTIQSLKEILLKWRGNDKRSIQAVGLEISSRAIFYIIPLIFVLLNIILILLLAHLSNIICGNAGYLKENTFLEIRDEIFRHPNLHIFNMPIIGFMAIFLPMATVITIPLIQLFSKGARGVELNTFYMLLITLIQFGLICLLIINYLKIQKNKSLKHSE